MFIGAQVSPYSMTSDFAVVIGSGLDALAPWRDRLRIEADDLSTLMVAAPDAPFDAIRDPFAGAAQGPAHVTLHATISRGCPG